MFTILATLDGSPESEAVLPAIAQIAKLPEAHVELLTVVEPPRATSRATSATVVTETPYLVPGATSSIVVERPVNPQWIEDESQALKRVLDEGRDYLSSFAHSLREAGVDIDVQAVVGEDVSAAITEYAGEHHVNLIAMATHGRSGLSELVQGSVAASVVRSGVAPVMLVRPAKRG